MIDKEKFILDNLFKEVVNKTISGEQVIEDCKKNENIKRENFISTQFLNFIIDSLGQEFEIKKREREPIKKLIFVEDGSIDIDDLEEELSIRNTDMKIVVYRNGSNKPEIKEI